MIDLLLITSGILGVWGIGIALAYCLLSRMLLKRIPLLLRVSAKINVAELLGLGLVLGFGATAIFYFLWAMVGLRFSSNLAYFWTGIGIVAGTRTLFIRYRYLFQKDKSESSAPRTNQLTRLCWGILLLLAATTMLETLMTPQRFWDERAIFGLKAIVIFQDGTVQSESLHDPNFVQYHPKYPLLIPLNEAHIYFLLGEVNDRWSKVMFPLLYLGMILTYYGVLVRTIVSRFRASIFTLMLATVPAMAPWEYGFLSGQADAPVACFHLVAVLYLWSFLKSFSEKKLEQSAPDSGLAASLIIAGLATGLTIFTKDEGIALFLVDLIALFIVTGIYFRDRLIYVGTLIFQFAIVTVLLVAPWFYYRTSLPSTMEMTYFSRMQISTLAEGFTSLQWAIQHLWRRMFIEVPRWGLQWWGVVVSLIAFPLRAIKPHQLFLLLDILGAISALVLAGLIAPTPIEEHIGGSSHRFLIQISGTAVLFIAGQWTEHASPHSTAISGNSAQDE